MIAKEVAKEDLDRFMESFKLDPIKKKKIEEKIEVCIDLIEAGMLVVTEDNKLKYTLLEPIVDEAGKTVCGDLTFNGKRIRVQDIENIPRMATEAEQSKILIGVLTGVNKGIIGKFTMDDITYLSAIAGFFTPAL